MVNDLWVSDGVRVKNRRIDHTVVAQLALLCAIAMYYISGQSSHKCIALV